jgi:hypothetical protein
MPGPSVFEVFSGTVTGTGGSTLSLSGPPLQAIPAGSVLVMAADNQSFAGAVVYSDTAGNTFNASNGVLGPVAGVTLSDTVTVSFASSTDYTDAAVEFIVLCVVGATVENSRIRPGTGASGNEFYAVSTSVSGFLTPPQSWTLATHFSAYRSGGLISMMPLGIVYLFFGAASAFHQPPPSYPSITDSHGSDDFTQIVDLATVNSLTAGFGAATGTKKLRAGYAVVTGLTEVTASGTFTWPSGDSESGSYTIFGLWVLAGSGNPAILAPQRGGFHIAYAKDGDIKYKTSHTPGKPNLGSEISVTGGTADTEPVMVDTHRQGRIYLAFVRGGDTYYCYSDGDGESGTWSTPVSIFAGCKHPAIAFDRRNGMLWLGAWDPGTGHIKTAAIQPIGAAPTSPVVIEDDTGTALVFDDDTFQVAAAYEGSGRWELIAMQSGAATVWQSVDDGNSFVQVV